MILRILYFNRIYFGLIQNDSDEISRNCENDNHTDKRGQCDPKDVILSEIITNENGMFPALDCFWIQDTSNNTDEGNNNLDDCNGDHCIFSADSLMVGGTPVDEQESMNLCN